MTRRLDPLERVKELGDASVPFPFDIHAIDEIADVVRQHHGEIEVLKIAEAREFRQTLAMMRATESQTGQVAQLPRAAGME